jgi:hypothetical protein
MTSRGGRQWREPSLCAHCRATVPHWKRLCDACWRRLPFDMRRAIAAAPIHLKKQETDTALAWLAAHRPAAETARRMGEPFDDAQEEGGRDG